VRFLAVFKDLFVCFAVHQVCTLSAGQLRDAAAGQLSAWVAQQHDLEIPAAGLNIALVSMPVL
jgi:hypothetical protein